MIKVCSNCRWCAKVGYDGVYFSECVSQALKVDPETDCCRWWEGYEKEGDKDANIECASDC